MLVCGEKGLALVYGVGGLLCMGRGPVLVCGGFVPGGGGLSLWGRG